MRSWGGSGRDRRGGFALVAVLLVLLALFALTAPFLLSVTGADRASVQAADRAAARLALDSALRHARGQLAQTHPALDPTPYHDSLEELATDGELPAEFLDPSDPSGVMWSHGAEDLAGLVDLASAPPQMIANLLDAVTRLTRPAEAEDTAFEVASAGGFQGTGFLWVGGELVHHSGREAARLFGLQRGLGGIAGEEGVESSCGPGPAMHHDLGAYVIDQRAYALPRWRMALASDGRLAPLDSVEQLAEAVPFAMAEAFGPDDLSVLARTATAHGGVGAGPEWQAPVRLVDEPSGEPEPGCRLRLSSARAFNAGTIVRIRDGDHVEFGLVRGAGGPWVQLADPLQRDYRPHTATVEALARRPVNLNTAGHEVLRALFVNLKLVGASSRITPREAETLVELVIGARPFTGFEDFLRRLVLPAAGLEAPPGDATSVPEALRQAPGRSESGGVIDADDARALYYNARNANDARLEFSTMPFSFTSRGVHRLDLRAAVNARNGLERAHARREQVEHVVPQRPLLQVWTRQEDFDEAPRLTLDAPGWTSGPTPTGRQGEGPPDPWPSRARAHLGPHAAGASGGSIVRVGRAGEDGERRRLTFPSREEDGWIQPAPVRVHEGRAGRGNVLHFDDESESLEGHYLADGPLAYTTTEFGWAGGSGYLSPLALRGWIQPRGLQAGARLLDVGGSFTDSDAIRLEVEGDELVLRVLDGGGDHPDSAFEEVGEVRYSLAEGPGLPNGVWSHVEVGVAGNRPDQMRLLVDGRWPTKTPGLTRLDGALGPDTTRIHVESTEGFPERCVLRIGDELIEAVKASGTTFDATHHLTGELAGFGGRLARERMSFEGGRELSLALGTVETAHASGAAVQHYGYSLPLRSNVPNTGGQLGALSGPFGVARAVGIRVGTQESLGRDIFHSDFVRIPNEEGGYSMGYPSLGVGLPGSLTGRVAIQLDSLAADGERAIEEVMTAFSSTGGYAVLCSARLGDDDSTGARIGGIEVVHYSGWSNEWLLIERRGSDVPELEALALGDKAIKGVGSFVFHWDLSRDFDTTFAPKDSLAYQTLVFPISIPVPGASGITGFLEPARGRSELAQITRLEANAELTEWIRYDEVVGDHLVRDDPYFLGLVLNLVEAASGREFASSSSAGAGGNGSAAAGRGSMTGAAFASTPSASPGRSIEPGSRYWSHLMGVPEVETEEYPVTRAISSTLQFRGVMGTYSHAHGGTGSIQVLPIWKVNDVETLAQPGRFDHVMFLDEDPRSPAFPAVVHRAHRPHEYLRYSWTDGEELTNDLEDPVIEVEHGLEPNVVYVALQEPLPVPFAPSSTPTAATGQPAQVDTRTVSRVTKFPSGELPREAPELQLGGALRDGVAPVPSVVVDEVEFLADSFQHALVLRGTAPPLDAPEVGDGELKFAVREILRTPAGEVQDAEPLVFLPEGGGLLRMGDEIVCYRDVDVAGDVVVLAQGGRGMLGTTATSHVAGESVTWLESWSATTLAQAVEAGSHELQVVSTRGFPPEGTVLIGEELVHYTHIEDQRLAMPRSSERAGAQDRQGNGLFRGRFGTTASSHVADTPVILWPFRYWDRWSPRADAPELHYHGLGIDQPDALWKRVFWSSEPPAATGSRFGVLQSTQAGLPWDADPEVTDGLDLLRRGRLDAEGHGIVRQSDRIRWRVFVEYEPGSFDATAGLAHGWKCVPRLRLFGAEYLAPGRVLRRVER